MKTNTIKFKLTFLVVLFITSLSFAQQLEVEHNSSSVDGAQILLTEKGDPTDGVRMQFYNDADLVNFWSIFAKPQTGETDGDGILDSHFALTYSGLQKFAVGKDGKVRINKAYVLPTSDGDDGQVLKTDGTGVSSFDWVDYTETNATVADPTFRLHNTADAPAFLTFSNTGFANNRWVIAGDPSGADAAMKFTWGNTTNPGAAEEYMIFGFDAADPYLRSDQRLGLGTIPYFSGTSGFKLHVVSPNEPAAHFGAQTTSNPANGYVTINHPTTYGSQNILTIRNDGSSTAVFSENETNFYQEVILRDDVSIINADLDVQGSVTIDDLLIIEPRVTAPTCAASGTNNGTIYLNQVTDKLRLCIDGTWENLN